VTESAVTKLLANYARIGSFLTKDLQAPLMAANHLTQPGDIIPGLSE